jgi:hypothetical protein
MAPTSPPTDRRVKVKRVVAMATQLYAAFMQYTRSRDRGLFGGRLRLWFSIKIKITTTHSSILKLQTKREDIIDKCRECDKDIQHSRL